MTKDEIKGSVIQYWLRKADTALESAHSEVAAGRFDFATNRVYYACFYAASAVLLEIGLRFVKHAGVRGAIHQHLVKTGKLDAKWAKAYDRIFENRQMADYLELYEPEEAHLEELLHQAEGFVSEMKLLLGTKVP